MSDEPDWDMADPNVGEPFCEWAGNVYIWLSRDTPLDDLRAYFTENLPGPDERGMKVSAFMRDYSLRQSPHYFRESGHLQWDLIDEDLSEQLRKLTYGEVFHTAASEIIAENGLAKGAAVIVVLYESEQGAHNAFQPKRPRVHTPLIFVGRFCIDGELTEVHDALPDLD